MKVWAVLGLVGGGTFVLKAAGPLLLGRRPLPPRVARMLTLLAPALLAALVLTQTLAKDGALVVDARAPGVGAAAVAALLRAPMAVVVIVAAATTALIRLL